MALSTSPLPSEDDDLVELKAALSLIPITDWQSPETPEGVRYNAEKRRDLMVSLTRDAADAMELFNANMRDLS